MTIQIDSREKAHAIARILDTFEKRGVMHFVSKLPVGDYMSYDNPRVVIDRKQSLSEVCGNVCQGHARFVRELERARHIGVKLIFLVEHGRRIKALEDVRDWVNPRLKVSPNAVSGERLYRIMLTMKRKYGIEWVFCEKQNTGKRIIEILNLEGRLDDGTNRCDGRDRAR